jgi:hypothetical protein
MNKIPTAIELTFQKFPNHNGVFVLRNIEEFMIEFAKLHVQAALENAYDCHTFKGWTNSDDENVHKELFVKNIMSRKAII